MILFQCQLSRRKTFTSSIICENFRFACCWLVDFPFRFLKKRQYFSILLISLKNRLACLSWNLDIQKLQPISFPTIYDMSLFIAKRRVNNFFTKKFVMSHLVVLVSWNLLCYSQLTECETNESRRWWKFQVSSER